jgi:ribonuclease D
MPDHTWIADTAGVAALTAAVAAASDIALDGEGNSMHAYTERLCLLQINAGGRIFLVDTLAVPREILAPLGALLAGAERCVLLHGGGWDIGVLRRDLGWSLGKLYDTQEAAAMLGWPETGYGAVVQRTLGITLEKGHATYDWGRRPIDPAALVYAEDDVRHLPAAAAAVRAAVIAADLAEEVDLACDAVRTTTRRDGFDPAGFWRIKDVRRLPSSHLPILAALWQWRDQAGQVRNLPPGRLINNEALLALARQAPTSFQQLKLVLRGWQLSDLGDAVIALIRDARQAPPPVPAFVRGRDVGPDEEERERRLKDWRRAVSAQRGQSLQAVLPARALEHLKQHGAGDLGAVPQLGPKRINRDGHRLRELCAAGATAR